MLRWPHYLTNEAHLLAKPPFLYQSVNPLCLWADTGQKQSGAAELASSQVECFHQYVNIFDRSSARKRHNDETPCWVKTGFVATAYRAAVDTSLKVVLISERYSVRYDPDDASGSSRCHRVVDHGLADLNVSIYFASHPLDHRARSPRPAHSISDLWYPGYITSMRSSHNPGLHPDQLDRQSRPQPIWNQAAITVNHIRSDTA